jgi:hypothetical protein
MLLLGAEGRAAEIAVLTPNSNKHTLQLYQLGNNALLQPERDSMNNILDTSHFY